MTFSITRDDCTSEELHRLAGMCKDVRQSRRFRALAMVLDGVCRSEVASAQGTTVQSNREVAPVRRTTFPHRSISSDCTFPGSVNPSTHPAQPGARLGRRRP